MTCKHEFNYIGDQKGKKDTTRYFKCIHCGIVKVRSDDGSEYLIPAAKEHEKQ